MADFLLLPALAELENPFPFLLRLPATSLGKEGISWNGLKTDETFCLLRLGLRAWIVATCVLGIAAGPLGENSHLGL